MITKDQIIKFLKTETKKTTGETAEYYERNNIEPSHEALAYFYRQGKFAAISHLLYDLNLMDDPEIQNILKNSNAN